MIGVAKLLALVLALLPQTGVADGAAPVYVGAAACAACHEREHRRWTGSHHDLAMQEANDRTVLGDFADAALEVDGTTTRFRTRDGRYLMFAEGSDGTARDHEVRYTFGVEPLQQYLVALPGGRLQAHDIAWDSRPEADGGQRWFHLRPGVRATPGDPLHWTGPSQSWNARCAECHSTNVRKNFDLGAKAYDTAWSDVDVACEACHGPGSRHVAWAEPSGESRPDTPNAGLVVSLEPAKAVAWVMDASTGIARRSRPRTTNAEVESCAPCHSRRSRIVAPASPGRPYLDGHRPALLENGLYHADGQIDDEVYVYGSFLQSKMFRAGVGCGDCHDPHAPGIREPLDAVCAKCHAPATFATSAHHFHPAGSAGARCVECHMPAKRYMVVDDRRDHGFRVPRPDLSVELGTPNACTGCHADRDVRWAAEAVDGWYGGAVARRPTFARALDAGRRTAAAGVGLLIDLVADRSQPGIARATGLSLLARYRTPAASTAIATALADEEALVRMAAAEAAAALGRDAPVDGLFALLSDARLAVRIEAARSLAPLLRSDLPPERRDALQRALEEYRRAQEVNADHPEAHVNLGSLQTSMGDVEAAERSYRTAIAVGSHFLPAYVNLADVLRARGRDVEGEAVLRDALAVDPDAAAVHHALGLLLVRTGRRDVAIEHLRKAAVGAPDDPRFAYVHAVALRTAGETDAALAVLRDNHERHDGHADTLLALATISRDAGARDDALRWAERLAALDPSSPTAQALVRELRPE